jgi:hypothetical protein
MAKELGLSHDHSGFETQSLIKEDTGQVIYAL